MRKTKARNKPGKARGKPAAKKSAARAKVPSKSVPSKSAPSKSAPAKSAPPIDLPAGEPGNAAIFYDPDGYDTSRKKLVGRHAAGEGFLLGFARHAEVERFYCLANTQGFFDRFTESIQNSRPGAEVGWIKRGALEDLAEPGSLFYPSPTIGPFAWRRRSVGDHRYSLCGVTHTTATHAIMDSLGSLLTDPVYDWDAVICTSSVVRETVDYVTGAYREHFAERFGATRLDLPQFPVIPLGVDCERFQHSPAARKALRDKLGIAEDDVVYLFVGRLSFFEKAHPLPMYVALEQAAKRSKRRLHLIQAGWFPNDLAEREFKAGAKTICPSVNCLFLDGREPEIREGVWSAADVFTSLSDNIQETFGLTPIEAMAAGLPVVVSDWNGYKDTVRDGVDGFRVRTMMPGPSMGLDLANRFADGFDSYGRYCGATSLHVAVDPQACAAAYLALAEDPALRSRMGEAGRRRALDHLDWSHVVKQYQDLWAELAARRHAAARAPTRPPAKVSVHPGRRDPFEIFASYPTDTLGLDDRVSLVPGVDLAAARTRCNFKMVNFVKDLLPRGDDCLLALDYLAKHGPCPARTLLEQVANDRRRRVFRGLVWLYKLDLVAIEPAQQ